MDGGVAAGAFSSVVLALLPMRNCGAAGGVMVSVVFAVVAVS
jgi:hypothetical protein